MVHGESCTTLSEKAGYQRKCTIWYHEYKVEKINVLCLGIHIYIYMWQKSNEVLKNHKSKSLVTSGASAALVIFRSLVVLSIF